MSFKGRSRPSRAEATCEACGSHRESSEDRRRLTYVEARADGRRSWLTTCATCRRNPYRTLHRRFTILDVYAPDTA
jgi:hypothetical protein